MLESLVSVIMPAYNAEKFIVEAIESILNQTHKNWELIICDDASVDNTKSIINSYANQDSRIIVSHNNENQKLLKTRNRLLTLAKGEFVTFQDADDYSHPDRLSLMVQEFFNNKSLGLLASQVAYVDVNNKVLRKSSKPTTYQETIVGIYQSNVVGGSIMMIRRSAFVSVGFQFRPFLDGLSFQDYDLSTLIAQKFEAYSLPQTLYYYRQSPNSASKKIDFRRLVAKDLVIHLAKQRKERGYDDVMMNRMDLVDLHFSSLQNPYLKDPALVYRQFAASYMFNQLFNSAIKASWSAVKIRPFDFINFRTLLYCLRITLVKKLVGVSKG